MMNLMHLLRTRRDTLFHHELDSMSLILNVFLNSSIILMVLLLATKLVWWPRNSSSSMVLIMMLHSVSSSSRLLFVYCYLWRSPVIGLFGKLIFKMHFGVLDEGVYMKQPPGFKDSAHPNFLCKLDKSIWP
jgi:hypothetical protein